MSIGARKAWAALAGTLLGLASCDLLGPSYCTGELVYGLAVDVVSAETGQDVTEGLSGLLVDGSYTEEMEALGGNVLIGAGERAGDYTLVVTADGFETWGRADIRVRDDGCHVAPVHVTAELTPAESHSG